MNEISQTFTNAKGLQLEVWFLTICSKFSSDQVIPRVLCALCVANLSCLYLIGSVLSPGRGAVGGGCQELGMLRTDCGAASRKQG